ncbi:MAG: SAM-dependent chlorinase/fluorinase [Chloroflexota bacterium]|nr:SAM-dependent chlorinase/fluorinase [Chloroflexota bacterium]
MTDPLPIVLLTDFGTSDTYVGQVKGVLTARAPGAPLIDLTHEVSPYAIDEGAWLLETALPFLPDPAVVLAVVDPGVGSERLPIAVRASAPGDSGFVRYFVGPDNGLLSAVAPPDSRPSAPRSCPAPPGLDIRSIESPEARLATVSATFHGRDLFAPAAAHIAVTGHHEVLGPTRDELTLLPPFAGRAEGTTTRGNVIHVDRYGNLVTTIRKEQLPPDFTLDINGHTIERIVRTFSDASPGALACHVDSSSFLAIAEREGNAAARTGAARGDDVVLTPR